jgi:hypothetical protein
MSVSVRVWVLSVSLLLPGSAALAQYRGAGGSHAGASSGHFGAAPFTPRSPVYPSASANSPGFPASAYSLGIPASAHSLGIPASPYSSSIPPSVYPGFGFHGYPPYGSASGSYSAAGPWRAGSKYGKNGYRSRYGYGYAGLPYFPLLGYYDNGFYDAPPYPAAYPGDPSLEGEPTDTAGLSAQVQQLSAQLNDLQNQLSQRNLSPSAGAPDATPQQGAPAPPLTVVLNSGQTLQIQNYAVMGDTLWDLSSQTSHRIPVSSIDIPASTKASEATGAEFPQLIPKPTS